MGVLVGEELYLQKTNAHTGSLGQVSRLHVGYQGRGGGKTPDSRCPRERVFFSGGVVVEGGGATTAIYNDTRTKEDIRNCNHAADLRRGAQSLTEEGGGWNKKKKKKNKKFSALGKPLPPRIPASGGQSTLQRHSESKRIKRTRAAPKGRGKDGSFPSESGTQKGHRGTFFHTFRGLFTPVRDYTKKERGRKRKIRGRKSKVVKEKRHMTRTKKSEEKNSNPAWHGSEYALTPEGLGELGAMILSGSSDYVNGGVPTPGLEQTKKGRKRIKDWQVG